MQRRETDKMPNSLKKDKPKKRSMSNLLGNNGDSLDSSPSPSGASTPSRRDQKDKKDVARTGSLLSSVTTFLSTPRSNSSSSSNSNDNSYASARSSLERSRSFTPLSRARNKADSLPAHHLPNNAGFKNPWPSAQPPGWQDFLSPSFPLTIAKHPDPTTKPTQTIDPDWSKYDDRKKSDAIVATWLGHAVRLLPSPRFLLPADSSRAGRPRSTPL